MTWKRYWRKRSWPNQRFCPDLCINKLKKTTEHLSQDIRCPVAELNRTPPNTVHNLERSCSVILLRSCHVWLWKTKTNLTRGRDLNPGSFTVRENEELHLSSLQYPWRCSIDWLDRADIFYEKYRFICLFDSFIFFICHLEVEVPCDVLYLRMPVNKCPTLSHSSYV